MDKTTLGDRMKAYEAVSKTKLMNRTPVIIRLDGKAFHTWTKKLHLVDANNQPDPFDADMHKMMTYTALHVMNHVQNAVMAYTQSDEISILLNDWKKLNTDQWFGNAVQKMVSISASAATASFNYMATGKGYVDWQGDLAMFDSRVFNIPKEEVANYFIWRQQDATRNSINMLGQHYFSHKELQGKNVSQVQDMLMLEHQVNWNDLDTWKKRGTCIVNSPNEFDSRAPLYADEDIPIFTKDREYIERYLEADSD